MASNAIVGALFIAAVGRRHASLCSFCSSAESVQISATTQQLLRTLLVISKPDHFKHLSVYIVEELMDFK
jgi:hypothetical protein